MQITVELPNDIAQHADPGREALEALTIAGYRAGKLSGLQAARLLGQTRMEFEDFLKDRHILDHSYSSQDLAADIQVCERLRLRKN